MPKSQGTSVSSFSSAPSHESVVSRLDDEGGGGELEQWGQGFVVGIFGVLFTIVKERYNTGIRWLTLKVALDFLQLFTMVFKPSDGWVIKEDVWLWKLLRMFQFEDFIRPRGYSIFLAALYTMIGMLSVALALSAWVAWCFQNRSFPFVWPIKLLRVYANIFYQILDVAVLTLLQLPFDCHWIGYPAALRNRLSIFPSVTCTDLPHLAHMAAAGAALIIYLLMAGLNLMADFELNPTTRNLYATANSAVEVRAFGIKFLMTVINYAIGWRKVQDILLLLCSFYLTWIYLKWQPHLFGGVNHLRVGLNTTILTVNIGAVVLIFQEQATHEFRQQVTTITFAVMGPAALLGAAISYIRLSWWTRYVLMRYRTAPPGQKARRIYKFQDSREVEIVARVCRKWTDQHYEVLDNKAAKEAEIVIKGGMQLFPTDAFMAITYVNFLIDVLENTQTGNSQLQAAKKLNPNLMERFALFAREQEHMQRSAGAKSGESSVDLVSYVEYQRNHRLVMRAHRAALVAIRNFWQLLLHNSVAFTSLAKALHRIEKSVSVAEGSYRAALQRYPASPKLLRGYGKFLEAVKNNPWKASTYFSEADKLQDQQQQDEATLAVMGPEDGKGGGGGAANMLHRVDERVNTVFLINSAGIIQMANKNACSLLGYNKGELDGKNINVVMPPPFSQRHNRYIRQYIQTGREQVISSVNQVVALHKARYVLPVKLAVSKVSGATEDSIFMGVLEPVATDPLEAHLYLLQSGIVTGFDQAFAEWTGYEITDVFGKELTKLVADPELINAVLPKFDPVALAKQQRAEAAAARTADSAAAGQPTSPTKNNPMGGMVAMAATAAAHAANAAAATTAASMAGPESLSSVAFLHKYTTRPVECSVILQRLGVGTECIVEVTLRRRGPAHLLALTGPSGRVRYIASELARALGTSPTALYRQPLGDIMPQPWGTLHAAWIKGVSSMGSEVANTGVGSMGGSMGGAGGGGYGGMMGGAGAGGFGMGAAMGGGGGANAVVPGSCRSGITTVLGSSLRQQGYYRLQISTKDDPDSPVGEVQHIIEATPSSKQAALSERRLVLTVDADGVITDAEDAPTWLFGFKPMALLGRSLQDVVTTLRSASQGQPATSGDAPTAPAAGAAAPKTDGDDDDDVSTPELLSMLISKAMMHNGSSWRVGVTAPVDEAELRALGPMRDAVLAKRTAAAIMEIEVSLDTESLSGDTGDGAAGGTGAVTPATAASRAASRNPTGTGIIAGPTPKGDGGSGRSAGMDMMSSRASTIVGAPYSKHSVDGVMPDGAVPSSDAIELPAWLRNSRLSSVNGMAEHPRAPLSHSVSALSPLAGVPGLAGPRAAVGTPVARGRVRRNSWVAVEGPGGGILVVSGAAMGGAATSGRRSSTYQGANTGVIPHAPSSPSAAAAAQPAVPVRSNAALPPGAVRGGPQPIAEGVEEGENGDEEEEEVEMPAASSPRAAAALAGGGRGFNAGSGGGDSTSSRPRTPSPAPFCPEDPPELLRLDPSFLAAAVGTQEVEEAEGAEGHEASVGLEAGVGEQLLMDEGVVMAAPVEEEVRGRAGRASGSVRRAAGEVGGAALGGEALRGSFSRGLTRMGSGGNSSQRLGSGRAGSAHLGGSPRMPAAAEEEAGPQDGQKQEQLMCSVPPQQQQQVMAQEQGQEAEGTELMPGEPVGDGQYDGAEADVASDDMFSDVAPASAAVAPNMSAASTLAPLALRTSFHNEAGAMLLGRLLSMKTGGMSNGPLDTMSSAGGDDLACALMPNLFGGVGASEARAPHPPTPAVGAGTATRTGAVSAASSRHRATIGDGGVALADVADGDDDSVDLPLSVADDARVVIIRVSLWRADLMSAVVEIDNSMTVTALVGEELAPPGLLFGLSTPAVVAQPLHSLLQLTDRSVAGLFQDPATARRGGLKSAAKEISKVGALQEVVGLHWDGSPVDMTLQAVTKESAPNRTYVILKPRKPSRGTRGALLRSVRDLGMSSALQPLPTQLVEEKLAAEATGGFCFGEGGAGADRKDSSGDGRAVIAVTTPMPPVRDTALLRSSFDSSRGEPEAEEHPLKADRQRQGDGDDLAVPIRTSGLPPPATAAATTSGAVAVAGAAAAAPHRRSTPQVELLSVDARQRPPSHMGSEADGEMIIVFPPGAPPAGTLSSSVTSRMAPPSMAIAAGPQRGQQHPFATGVALPPIAPPAAGGSRVHGSNVNNLPLAAYGGSSRGAPLAPISVSAMVAAQMSPGAAAAPAALTGDSIVTIDVAGGLQRASGSQSQVQTQAPGMRQSADTLPSGSNSVTSSDSDSAPSCRVGEHGGGRISAALAGRPSLFGEHERGRHGLGSARHGNLASSVMGAGSAAAGRSRSPGRRSAGEPPRFSSNGMLPGAPAEGDDRRYGEEGASPAGGGGGGGGGGDGGGGGGGEGDIDDAASDMSGVSGVSEAIDASGHTADYRRGKRYKKLLKVLESPIVQRAARDFQWQALLANVMQLLANALAFIVLTVMLTKQAANVSDLHAATAINRKLHETFIVMQKLNNIYEGLFPVSQFYTNGSIAELTDELNGAITDFASLNTAVYKGIGNLRPDFSAPYNPYVAQDIWNKPVHNETLYFSTTVDNETRSSVDFRNASLWDISSGYIERASEIQHMHKVWGGEHGTLTNWDAYKWVITNGLQPMYNGYSDALLQLTSTVIVQAEAVNRVQLVLLILQGGVICCVLLFYMWWLQRRVSTQRYSLYSLFMLVPVGLLRALASKSVSVADNSDNEASSDDDQEQQQQQEANAITPTINLMLKNRDTATAKSKETSWSRITGWFGRGTAPPTGADGAAVAKDHGQQRGGGGSRDSASKQRQLVPSNHDSISLLVPFIVWGALICVLYTAGYLVLRDTTGPLSLLSTHNIAVVRLHRVMYYALHLNSQTGNTSKEMLQPILEHELRNFEHEWDVLLYGANETDRLNRRFEFCKTNTAFVDAKLSFKQFRMSECLGDAYGGDPGICHGANAPFYAATTHGVAMMIDRFKEDVSYLVRLPAGDVNINNTHLEFILAEGEGNIELGLDTVASSLLSNIGTQYDRVELLQIFSLVVSWLLAAVFVFVQLRPFVASNKLETQRIARMLSELPPEIDIEGLVARVLLRDGHSSSHGHNERREGGGGGGTGLATSGGQRGGGGGGPEGEQGRGGGGKKMV